MYFKMPNKTAKEMLLERGIRQVQVALDLDIHPSRLNLILNGWLIPGEEQQRRIAEYLDVKPSDLGWSE
jgi:hypothetical protein